MNLSSELEKLVALRDQGDLTEDEFEKAKKLLLSGQEVGTSSAVGKVLDSPTDIEKKTKTYRLLAYLSTITVVLSAVSAFLIRSPIKIVILVLFVIVATRSWSEYSKLKRVQEK